MITLTNVCKHYGENHVLENLCADFATGRITCITGRSGCGKTTLLRLLMGLERPDSGRIENAPSRFAAVFQENRLLDDLSVEANLRAVLGRTDPVPLLTALGLGDALHKRAGSLSGGMQRRVAIARAVLTPVDTLYMDEPFSGLDTKTRATVLRVLKPLLQNKTALLVTHSAEDAAALDADLWEMNASIQRDTAHQHRK